MFGLNIGLFYWPNKLSGLETSSCIFLVFLATLYTWYCCPAIHRFIFQSKSVSSLQRHHWWCKKKITPDWLLWLWVKQTLQLHLFFLHLSDTVSKLLKPLSIPGISLLPRNSWLATVLLFVQNLYTCRNCLAYISDEWTLSTMNYLSICYYFLFYFCTTTAGPIFTKLA